jgi:hypothetical protein
VRLTEELGHEFSGGGHDVVSGRAIYGQRTFAIFESGRKGQGWEIATLIDMEMTEEKDFDLRDHIFAPLPPTRRALPAPASRITRALPWSQIRSLVEARL